MSATGPLPGAPVQLAWAVDDVRAAARRWSSRGVGPFFVLDHIELSRARVDGRTGEFDHSSAYGWWGEVMVELLQDHAPDPRWRRPPELHHVACFVDDVTTAADAMTDHGWPEVLRAETAGGTTFAFHDARDELGHLVEVYVPDDRLRGFYRMVRGATERWDGSDPVRTL